MSVFPAAESVPAVLRHAEERRDQQRLAEADRRATALEQYVAAVGGQAEAAEGLGISVQAVSKSLVAARRRQPGEPPLAGLMELDLLRCGAQVPSMREWQALGPDARRDAAERGALIWAALAHALTQLHRETHAACQFLAGVQIGALDPDDPEDAAERPHLVDDRDMAAAARRTDRSTALTWAFGDLADTLTARLDEAWRALDWWQGQLDSLDGLTEE